MRPGADLRLARADPRSSKGAPSGKDATEATFAGLTERLWDLQERLWAERERALLVVFQAIDAGGKDGAVKHLAAGLHPVGSRAVSFKAPSADELAHDFLWRIHSQTPARGEIVLFNRSHYEDVLVVRVHDLVPEKVWRLRYELIRDFERNLVASGTAVVKIFLHISADEQAERLRDRLADPTKHWKFRREDLEERARWDDYQAAFEEAIVRTTTDDAPWYVVPADRKWYRNWAVSHILIDTLERLDPHYPASEDLSGIVVE